MGILKIAALLFGIALAAFCSIPLPDLPETSFDESETPVFEAEACSSVATSALTHIVGDECAAESNSSVAAKVPQSPRRVTEQETEKPQSNGKSLTVLHQIFRR